MSDLDAREAEVHHVAAGFDGRGLTTGEPDPPVVDPLTAALDAFVTAVRDSRVALQQRVNSLEGENAELRTRLGE